MTLLGEVVAHLERNRIRFALIGASAMMVHGVNRSTHDFDLFTLDETSLNGELWESMKEVGVEARVRRGDLSDPLAGVVRLKRFGELPVDLVVGKYVWQREALERAQMSDFGGLSVPVVRAADLILLKLYAGGPQDAWDIAQLLTGEDNRELSSEVESLLGDLPARCTKLWRRIQEE